MFSSPSAITERKSSCQALGGFLGCPSLSFSTIKPFISGVLFRQYHDSETGPWNCLVALHGSARVGWSPGKCQISLVFSNLFVFSYTLACTVGEGWSPICSPFTESLSGGHGAEWPTAPWAVVLTGALGWQGHMWHHTPLLPTGLQLRYGLCFTLLLPKEFGRENREHLLESSPSARADPAYSLLPGLHLFLTCVILSCVDLPVCKASTPSHL